jgi:glyoxalase family protein
MQLLGLHHVTAVSSRIRDNHQFYTKTLGMRLVKRSVNQDDVSAYHLFYADAKGSPGSDLTFFDWSVPTERRGTRAITRTALRVAGPDTLAWWAEHFRANNVTASPITARDGRQVLDFEDFEGQRLTLIDDGGSGVEFPWDRSPVEPEFQIRGLGPITISVPVLAPTDALVQKALLMRPVRTYPHPETSRHTVHVYEMGDGGATAELHVAVQPDLSATNPGAGGVHHVAFRIPDADYEAWSERLNSLGIPNSGQVDRYWFQRLYLREPNGVLFELATDGPGFGVDEDEATLGEKVVLAPFLEPQRDRILANLKPID